MHYQVEQAAADAHLRLTGTTAWTLADDWPHISAFRYDLARRDLDDNGERWTHVGVADGYRITHDWTVERDLALWDEADALDQDVEAYVSSLVVELRAYHEVFGNGPDLSSAQRVTILRHVEVAGSEEPSELWHDVVASLAMMDAPVFMLVDPHDMPDGRKTPGGKLGGRGRIAKLLDLGFSRMVSSRFVWAWNRDMDDSVFADCAYEDVLKAKQEGRLDAILPTPIHQEMYGPMSSELARNLGLSTSDDLQDD